MGAEVSDDGSEYVSTHDRGAFGKLMAEARDLGARYIQWDVDLTKGPEDDTRWGACALGTCKTVGSGGRTGEEALRRLVEKLRG